MLIDFNTISKFLRSIYSRSKDCSAVFVKFDMFLSLPFGCFVAVVVADLSTLANYCYDFDLNLGLCSFVFGSSPKSKCNLVS